MNVLASEYKWVDLSPEEEEFKAIYKMDVVQIPTNKTVQREDLSDAVYKNVVGKL